MWKKIIHLCPTYVKHQKEYYNISKIHKCTIKHTSICSKMLDENINASPANLHGQGVFFRFLSIKLNTRIQNYSYKVKVLINWTHTANMRSIHVHQTARSTSQRRYRTLVNIKRKKNLKAKLSNKLTKLI